jgi:hypothetical protein
MSNQLKQLLHQSLQGISPARAGGASIIRKLAPVLRDTKATEPTAKQKKAKRRASKQARRK